MINGVLYFSAPDHVWALDARTGREIWHYAWKTRGGDHIGNRGVGILDKWLYFLTPDNYFVSLDVATGKERWHHEIANMKREYFSTNAPMIIGKQVIIGVGGDALDVPGYLESRDPESGNLVWRWNTTPRQGRAGRGDAGRTNTRWRTAAACRGCPAPTIPSSTSITSAPATRSRCSPGRAAPATTSTRARSSPSIPNTGKMAWYYQVTPHDTHDWDAAQTPVLIDGEFGGRPRKLLAQASRNGHYFLLDRATGEHLLTTKHIDSLNWTKGINAKGQPVRDPAKDASVPGTLVSPDTTGATNWPPPSFSPDTGLLYFGTRQTFSVMYLTDTDGRPQGWAAAERNVGNVGNALKAIDYKTGKVKWSRPFAMGPAGSLGGADGAAQHRGRPALRQRRRRQLRRLRRGDRQAALARRPRHEHDQRSADLPPRRPPIRRRRRRRLALRVRAAAVVASARRQRESVNPGNQVVVHIFVFGPFSAKDTAFCGKRRH